jgi:DUF1680 family protein
MGFPYQKAYEMTSVFEGLVEYYRATGDPQWKQSAVNYFRNVNEREITIAGNGGGGLAIDGECWSNMAFDQADLDVKRMMETCVGATWMKYCSLLLRLAGVPFENATELQVTDLWNGGKTKRIKVNDYPRSHRKS